MANVLILGGSEYQKTALLSIKNNNHCIHLLDKDENPFCKKYADFFEPIDYSDKSKVLQYTRDNKIDCIVPLNDFGVHAAFYVSQKLGLINSSYLTAKCATDKGLMRDVWSMEQVPQPKYKIFNTNDMEINKDFLNFPVVVKPTDSSGGRGITVAKNKEELKFSIDLAKKFTRNNNRIIIEEFIEGMEVTVECMAHKGDITLLTMSDKIKPDSKYRVATSLNYPAYFDERVKQKIFSIVLSAAESLGIANGIIHAELIVSQDESVINMVELGARGGGGHIFGQVIHAVTGIDAPKEFVNILLGIEPILENIKTAGCVYRFFNPAKHGIIKNIIYDKKIFENNFVLDYGFLTSIGERYDGLSDSLKRIGFVVTSGKDRNEAIKHADYIEDNIIFEIEEI